MLLQGICHSTRPLRLGFRPCGVGGRQRVSARRTVVSPAAQNKTSIAGKLANYDPGAFEVISEGLNNRYGRMDGELWVLAEQGGC